MEPRTIVISSSHLEGTGSPEALDMSGVGPRYVSCCVTLTNLAIALHLTSFISTFQEFPKRFERSGAIERLERLERASLLYARRAQAGSDDSRAASLIS